jgi:hypothetical protein
MADVVDGQTVPSQLGDGVAESGQVDVPAEQAESLVEAAAVEKRDPPLQRTNKDGRTFTFIVDGQEFDIPKPFLTIHSIVWAARLEEDPTLFQAEVSGEAVTFRMFAEYLQAIDGPNSEVTASNVLPLLHWGKEFGVDYISATCEEFLLSRPPRGLEPSELLEIAARHNMPLLYSKMTEVVAQGMPWVEVPLSTDLAPLPDVFGVGEIRKDLVNAHISMGLMRNDGEMRRRHRFADQTVLDEPKQRARLLWKNRKRFVAPPGDAPEHDWRALQTVWPHHSLRSDDWTVVPCEAQPTKPIRARPNLRNR